jgi:hypothetical protein
MENCMDFINYKEYKEKSWDPPLQRQEYKTSKQTLKFVHEHADLSRYPDDNTLEEDEREGENGEGFGDDNLEGVNHYDGMTQYQECLFKI